MNPVQDRFFGGDARDFSALRDGKVHLGRVSTFYTRTKEGLRLETDF